MCGDECDVGWSVCLLTGISCNNLIRQGDNAVRGMRLGE